MTQAAATKADDRKEFIHKWVRENPTGEATALYDAMEKAYPKQDRSKHRQLVYRELEPEDRPWEQRHACPSCEIEAQGLESLDQVFGFRNMSDGKRRVQSWCRACRREDALRRRAKKGGSSSKKSKDKFAVKSAAAIKEEFTIPDLKDELRKRDLKVSGNKPDLIHRLKEYAAS